MEQVRLAYTSTKHRMIRDALWDRISMSRQDMSERYEDWKANEEIFLAYMPESDNDALRKQKRKGGSPQLTRFQIPYSYAVALTAHTYWTSVFLSRDPVFQYSGRHGEPMNKVQAVEALMNYQVQVGGMMTPLYIWLLDPTKYGFGVVGLYWDEEEVVVSKIEEVQETYLGIPIPGKYRKERTTERIPGYQGNRLYNVRPQDFFPDTRVPIGQFQKGEFCARYTEVGWNTIIKRQQAGQYFNIEELERKRTTASQREMGSEQIILPDAKTTYQVGPPRLSGNGKKDKSYVSLYEIYVELVPREWELGKTEWPEKWVFTIAEDEVIISAQPMGMYHNQFPFAVQEYEPDGYSLFSRSLLETVEPLNNTLTWLINTHLQSVRKAINDQVVVDPSRIVMKDLSDPAEGRVIRLKPEFYGTDVRQAVHQLQIVDITQNHLRDANVMTDLIQRVTGVTDNIMGMTNDGGRKTATEIRTSSTFGINRLKTTAEYMSAMGWSPLSQMMLQSTQQNYDLERQYRIAGDLIGGSGGAFMDVSGESIQGFFDFVPIDGTMPVDRFAQANLWRQFVADLGNNESLAGAYDMRAIIRHMMQLSGAKNIKQFELEVVPDEQIREQAKAGNTIPVGETDVLKDQKGSIGPLG